MPDWKAAYNNGVYAPAAPSMMSPITMAMLGMNTSGAGQGQKYNTGTGQWEDPSQDWASLGGGRVGPPTATVNAPNPASGLSASGYFGGPGSSTGGGPLPPVVGGGSPIAGLGGGGNGIGMQDLASTFHNFLGSQMPQAQGSQAQVDPGNPQIGGGQNLFGSGTGSNPIPMPNLVTLPYRIPRGGPQGQAYNGFGGNTDSLNLGDLYGSGNSAGPGQYNLRSLALGNRPGMRSPFGMTGGRFQRGIPRGYQGY